MIRFFYAVTIFIAISLSYINLLASNNDLIQKIAGTNNDYGRSIAVDTAGNIYVLGDYSSQSLNFNNGISLSGDTGGDIFIAKYNSIGECQWAQKISGQGADAASQIKVDNSDNIYFTGYFSSSTLNFNNGYTINNSGSNDGFLAKYNSNGMCQWAQRIAGTNSDFAYGIDLDNLGNIFICGNFSSSSLLFNNGISLSNSGSLDAYIAKYDSNGICQWAQKIYGTSAEYLNSLSLDKDNNVLVAGFYTSSTLNFNNGITLTNSGSSDIFISKYSSNGTCQWAQRIWGTASDEAYSIDSDINGNVYITGSFTSPTLNFGSFTSISNFALRDAFVTKLDKNGSFKWVNKIYGNSNDYGKYLHIDKFNNIWVAGYYSSDSLIFSNTIKLDKATNIDAYLAVMDTNGIFANVNRVYGNSNDYIEGIASLNDNTLFIGYFNSNKLYLKNDSLAQTGLNDVFFSGIIGGGSYAGFNELIAPLNNQIGVSIRPIFESNNDKSFILYLSTDSTFSIILDTLVSQGKYLQLPYNLKYNTTYYAKSNNIIKFTTEVIKKEQLWNWRNKYPQGNDLNIIKYYNNDSIMAMGDLMTIMHSTNGGIAWKVKKTGATNYFNSVYFSPFEELIFGAGDFGTIYKSSDRGNNWSEININSSSNINSIYFADKNAGWLVGENGIIFKTTNNGNSWSKQNSNIINNLNSVNFANLNIGYIVGNNGIVLKTSNGGSVWNKLNSFTSSNLLGVTFMNLNKGFAYGDSGTFYRTSNGGNNWIQINLSTKQTLRELKFTNSLVGFIVADSGLVYKTTDGGNNWIRKNTNVSDNLYAISILNTNNILICGENGILLKSVNGGDNWTNLLIDKLGDVSLKYISFINNNDGYIELSPDSLYLKTTNGGENWYYQSTGTKVNKMFFISSNEGWAVGDSGKILKTIDGGLSWNLKPSNTTVNLVNLSFIDENNGWCTGDNGYLLITNDGGENWLSQNVGSDNNYTQVLFTDPNNGWVITDGSEILKTDDGGYNWNFQNNPLVDNLQKLFFLNNQIGWGIYGNNQIIKTTDGGNNWVLINTGYTNITDIYFVDNLNGWAAGDIIIYTDDGGYTWYQQGNITKNKINGLYFKNYNHGWAIGDKGTILEFDNTDYVILPPTLISPSNNSINNSLIPQFSWNRPEKSNYFKIQISKNSQFSQIVFESDLDSNSIKLDYSNKLEQSTLYYWRVKAFNSTDSSFWSTTFLLNTQSKLNKPILNIPNDGQLGVNHKPNFNWSSIQFADKYCFQLSTSITFDVFNTFNDTTNINTYTPPNYLSQVTNYFWRVKAINEGNESEWSEIYGFTTDTIATPSKPILISYSNNLIDAPKNGSLTWYKSSYAVKYRIQIAKDSNFSNIIIDNSSVLDTFYISFNLMIRTKYYWRVKAYNWIGDESSWSQIWNFTTLTYELVPDNWSIIKNTGKDATILIPMSINPKVDKRNIATGDAIGIFYSSGNEMKCAGYGVWNNANLAITIWGDNSQTSEKDGFADGEKYFIKMWDGQNGKELYVQYTISSGPDSFAKDAYTILGQLNGITPVYHKIFLKNGWNLISSYVKPENLELEAIFDKIKSKVNIVKNKYGNTYIPAYGINNIGNWNYKSAYQVYMNQPDTLSIKGIAVVPENETINLISGWYFVAYLNKVNNNIAPSLNSITSTNSLVICKNNDGLVYIPEYNINTIGNMEVGQGYNMFITNPPANLKYPANPPDRGFTNSLTPTPRYLIPEYSVTGKYSVVLIKIDAKDYDEIGVYNHNNKLVGSGTIFNKIAAIVVWGDNDITNEIDGAIDNELLNFKLLDITTQSFKNIELLNIYDLVNNHKLSEVIYKDNSLIKASGNITNIEKNLYIFPIPASNELTIKNIGNFEKVELYNLNGNLVRTYNFNSNYKDDTIELDLSNLPNGEYNLRILKDSNIISKKIIIFK